MRVLVACEESQRVCIEFRKHGHIAYSCDIVKCSGGHPEWHILGDVKKVINGMCIFKTEDGATHSFMGFNRWDMVIGFPPCTHLAVSGARYFDEKRKDGRQLDAIKFFDTIYNCQCDRVCVENPVNIIGGEYVAKYYPDYMDLPKPTQYINPWQFGHGETKKTGLWLKGLPPLTPTNIVDGREQRIWKMPPSPDRAKNRSKTYSGIAKAMATQWGL